MTNILRITPEQREAFEAAGYTVNETITLEIDLDELHDQARNKRKRKLKNPQRNVRHTMYILGGKPNDKLTPFEEMIHIHCTNLIGGTKGVTGGELRAVIEKKDLGRYKPQSVGPAISNLITKGALVPVVTKGAK
jgi:hypothetical protein